MKKKNTRIKFTFILCVLLSLCACSQGDASNQSSASQTWTESFGDSSLDNNSHISFDQTSDASVFHEDNSSSLISEDFENVSDENSSDNASAENSDFSSDDISNTSSHVSTESSEDEYNPDEDPAINPSVTIDSAAERYADKFTDGEIIQTDSLYKSSSVHVPLSEITYGGKLYFVQDIYIKDIECLSVGFAGGSFGAKYNDFVPNIVEKYISKGENVVSAINGDYCGLNGKGAIIRNGTLYGNGVAEYTICVIYKNGAMNIISKDKFNAQAEIAKGAWHAWDFGPSFLNKDGSPVTEFTERKSIKGSNPRTIIGYFEPGHYCFIVAGGRKNGSSYGVSFSQAAAFASNLGCKIAYNLDGGQSSVMMFGEKISNEEYQGQGRRISDIVYIKDLTLE